MTVTIAKIQTYAGSKFQSNWRRNCQVITDTNNNEYVNTPSISGFEFEEGKTYDNVGLGSQLFGKTAGKAFPTLNINKR